MRLRTPLSLLLLVPGLAIAQEVWEKPIAPGLVYRMEVDLRAPRVIHALRLSPKSPSLRWNAELAGGTINEDGTVKGRLTPAAMASQTSAIAAVNGDFFSFSHGAPIGMMVRKGELVVTPAKPRAVFAWGAGETAIGMGNSLATLVPEGSAPIPLDGLNQPVGKGGIAVFTRTAGTVQMPEGNLVAVFKVPDTVWAPSTVVQGTLESLVTDAKDMTVPEGRVLVVAAGNDVARLATLKVDQRVTFRLQTGGFDWEKFDNVIGGGPFLLRDNKLAVDATAQGFNDAFSTRRHPRTAIGKTKAGDVWIVAIDGRQAMSVGATLQETAEIMQRLGCTDAVNLDGGGSTALNVLGLTVNRPSDGPERPVSNGILIFGSPRPIGVGKLKLVLAPSVATDGTVTARVEQDGKPVPGVEILWTARGDAWIDQGGLVRPVKAGKATVMARVYGQTLEAEIEVAGPAPKPATSGSGSK